MQMSFSVSTDKNGRFGQTFPYNPPGKGRDVYTYTLKARLSKPPGLRVDFNFGISVDPDPFPRTRQFTLISGLYQEIGEWGISQGLNTFSVSGTAAPITETQVLFFDIRSV